MDCPICRRGEPNDIIGEGSASWYTASSPSPMVGYVCVVAKQHVVEPFELVGAERAAYWEDVLGAAEVISQLFHPMKINYEIHGNTIPHLHTHVFPRYPDDPFVGGSIDPRQVAVEWPSDDLDRLREALARDLGRSKRRQHRAIDAPLARRAKRLRRER